MEKRFANKKKPTSSKKVYIDVNESNPDFTITTPSPDDLMYVEWGIELLKQGIDYANGYLRHLLTLNVAVIGIYITLVDKKMVDPILGKWIMGFFFMSLLISFFGTLPYQKKIYFRCPSDVKNMTDKTYRIKKVCIWLSSFTFFVGLLLLSLETLHFI